MNNGDFIIKTALLKEIEVIKITGISFGIGFLFGYIYSVIGFFDLIILIGIGILSCNINNIIDIYRTYKSTA